MSEVWKYHWSPACESALIERSLYGATLEEAAAGRLLEKFAQAEAHGQGRRADRAALLLLEACRLGLHRHTRELLDRTREIVAEDGSFVSLVRAVGEILVLHASREPLEAHHLDGVLDLADAAYERACYLLAGLAGTPQTEENDVLDALNAMQQSALDLGDDLDRRALRHDGLRELVGSPGCSVAVRGAAIGLLFGDGALPAADLVAQFRGHLLGTRDSGHEGAAFLRGLLHSARSTLWQVPELIDSLHEVLRDWDEESFIALLPELRLAFADLTPRECDRVARTVVEVIGEGDDGKGSVSSLTPVDLAGFHEGDLLRGVEVNRQVLEILRQDGLENYGG